MININNKPWNKVRFTDIQKVLDGADDENFFFEFKDDQERPERLLKEISAFANTYGGYIFLGVTDDKTVAGCTAWTEQRIHNTIYNGITPIPDFDVRKFKHDGNTIYVIKVEEGSMPPYITNKGQIYERVSSGSCPVKDSIKLSQLYARHRDSIATLDHKIGIEAMHIHTQTPPNLCGYLDLGFEIKCMDQHKIKKAFFGFDVAEIGTFLKKYGNEFSISSMGLSYVITLAKLRAGTDGEQVVLPDAAMNSFVEVMYDGSVKFRICLFADPNSGKAEVSSLLSFAIIFRDIYAMIFQKSLDKNFIYARKYEKFVAIKQFTPYYNPKIFKNMKTYLRDHREKYGNNLILTNNRIPYNDYDIIDKCFIEKCGHKFNAEIILEKLFYSAYALLGYIDAPESK